MNFIISFLQEMLNNLEIQKIGTLHISKINYTIQFYFSFVPKFDLEWNKKKSSEFSLFVKYLKNGEKYLKKWNKNYVLLPN